MKNEIIVEGTQDEINAVIQGIRPNYPKQDFAEIHSKECYYFFGGVFVKFLLK